jgi:hypothetical protein
VYEVREIRSMCRGDRRQRAPKLPSPCFSKSDLAIHHSTVSVLEQDLSDLLIRFTL